MQIKKILFLTFSFLTCSAFLWGCTHSTGKSSVASLSNSASNKSSHRVKNDLTRSALILFNARVEAYPMTGAYLKTTLQEEGKKRGLSNQEIAALYGIVNDMQKNRSCFHVSLESGASQDAVNLGYWGINIIQNGKVMKGQFIDIYKPGFSTTTTSYYATTYANTNTTYINSSSSTQYYNSGTVCTAEGSKVDYMQGFQMKLLARFMKQPKEATLTWEDPRG